MGLVSEVADGEWTLDTVEEALVECHELWRRSPGGGKRPFAGDAPWHLMQAEAGDYGGDGQDGASSSQRPRPPLNAAEVAERDTVSGWLRWLDDPVDVQVVVLATRALHHEEPRVPWKELAKKLRVPVTDEHGEVVGWEPWQRSFNAIAGRYRPALGLLVCRLNGLPTRLAKHIAAAGFRREAPESRRNAGC